MSISFQTRYKIPFFSDLNRVSIYLRFNVLFSQRPAHAKQFTCTAECLFISEKQFSGTAKANSQQKAKRKAVIKILKSIDSEYLKESKLN